MADEQNTTPPDIAFRPKPSYEEAYRQLKEQFIARLQSSISVIDNILAQTQIAPLQKVELARAMHLAHGLAGSGTTFGFPAVTAAGRKADSQIDKIVTPLPDGETPGREEMAKIESLLRELRGACQQALAQAESAPGTATAPAKTTTPDAKETYHALIVDDDETVADMISLQLRQSGMRVSIARDGNAALRVIAREIPDIVVLDIMMPGISGHEVLRRLKQDADFVNVPVIMLTAQTEQKDVVSALHGGAIDYVVKPVDPEKLAARINRTLDAGRYTVMIADNDPLLLQLLESKYRNRGFRVILSGDGKEAWDVVQKKLPDLVVLDRMMPGLDGLTVLKNIREDSVTSKIPVIVLSARKEERDIDIGMKMGATDYITKPFMPDDLLTRSLKALKESSARD